MNTASTCVPICGDGIKTPEEQCDDFDVTNLDGCNSLCVVEAGWTCVTLANRTSDCTPICSDTRVVATEVCDDGVNSGIGGCLADCSGPMPGWFCTAGSLTTNSVCS